MAHVPDADRFGIRGRVLTVRRAPSRAWFLIRHGVESVIETAATREAAQVAFFILITFPAGLLLALWGASTALDDPGVREEIIDGIIEALPLTPGEGRNQVEQLLDGVADGAGTLGFLGGLALIWSASGAIGALRYSIAMAWPKGEPLPYFQGKALDVGLTLIVVPALLASLGLNLVDPLAGALGDEKILDGIVSLLFTELLPAIAVFGVLLVLYRVLPPAEASWRAAWPGALVAWIGAILVRYGTELYFGSLGGGATAVYGAIAALLAVSIAVYLLAIVTVVGANVSAVLARFDSWAGVDVAIEREREEDTGEGSVGRDIKNLVLSLFMRRGDD
jgi:membrane protein